MGVGALLALGACIDTSGSSDGPDEGATDVDDAANPAPAMAGSGAPDPDADATDAGTPAEGGLVDAGTDAGASTLDAGAPEPDAAPPTDPLCASADSNGFFSDCSACDSGDCDTISVGSSTRQACGCSGGCPCGLACGSYEIAPNISVGGICTR